MAALGGSNNNTAEFNEITADSDSEDDIPLCELRSLATLRQNDGSQGRTGGNNPDVEVNNDPDLGQEQQQDSDGESDQEIEENVFVDFSTAYKHDWLADFNTEHGHKLGAGAEDLSEIDLFRKILTDDIVDLFITETNRYAEQYFIAHPKDSLPPPFPGP